MCCVYNVLIHFLNMFLLFFAVRGLHPRSFTKIAYSDKLFELSWLPPKDDQKIVNYTVFWCLSENNRDRPYQVSLCNNMTKISQ